MFDDDDDDDDDDDECGFLVYWSAAFPEVNKTVKLVDRRLCFPLFEPLLEMRNHSQGSSPVVFFS